MTLAPTVFDAAMDELREKSRKALYQRDFAAWQWDVLGERSYEKMAEISEIALLGEKPRTLIKSGNGSGKTFVAARWVTWWVTAFEASESLAIVTAPTLRQVESGVMAYLKSMYGAVLQKSASQKKPMPWPGFLNEQNEWKYKTPGGNELLVVGRVPGAADAVSTMQGLRKTGGRNLIVLDEAGGVSADIYTAIEALQTSGEARMIGIGNPDRRGTPFYKAFTDPRESAEYNLFTISGYDLPTMTGEVVYPDNPEKQALMMRGLTSEKWILHKTRVWGTGGHMETSESGIDYRVGGSRDGRFKAKVLGQFPDADDTTFFPEEPINAAREREFTEEQIASAPIILGVDLASMGSDESVVIVNQGGRCRLFDKKIKYLDGGVERETSGSWAKEDTLSSTRRIHAIAKHLGATEVRVDGTGLGEGIATSLERHEEFAERKYFVLSVKGGEASADRNRWANARAQNHDNLRELLAAGLLDLDPDDEALRDQLISVTYDTNLRGAIQITPKKDMRSEMHGSPDRLDALIYACIDTSAIINPPLGDMKKGDVAVMDPWELLQMSREDELYPL